MKVFTNLGALAAGVFATLLLASCGGGDSLGGGTGEFQTVIVSAKAATTVLESDVKTGNTCSGTTSTGGTFNTDTVAVTVTSALQPKQTSGLNIAIDKATVHFDPENTASPQLDDFSVSTIGTIVAPGGSATVSVPVAPDSLKVALVTQKGLQLCPTTPQFFKYFVTITFEGVELGTGTRKGITASMNVEFADRS